MGYDGKTFIGHWLPYIVLGVSVVLLLLIALCIFCTSFRHCIHRFCCHCCPTCCRSEAKTEIDIEQNNLPIDNDIEQIYGSRSRSKSQSGGQAFRPNVRTQSPPVPSGGPTKHQLANAARTQKYIGNILAMGRRAPPPINSQGQSSGAPPAAKQVARTLKIIGNILHDKRGRRN